MEYILWFEKLTKDSGNLAGGKGSNLGEMVGLKLPVPLGFVIKTKAFEKFLDVNEIREEIQKIADETDVDDTQKLMLASKKIKNLILEKEMPADVKNEILNAYKNLSLMQEKIFTQEDVKLLAAGKEFALVAVRSSATTEDLPTASFAGQQASFLNVKGLKELIDAVKKCWASLFEPRAIFYRTKQGFHTASIAVVIQKMVNSEKSGVMFTVNPATGDDNIVIEATWGLGEALVSGAVQPDTYVVAKTGRLIEKKIGTKTKMKIKDMILNKTIDVPVTKSKIQAQVLTTEEILRLVEFGLKLEEHYEKPQDVEFAIEGGKVFIVQTRAVTTHARREELKITATPIVKGLPASPGIATGTVRIVHGLEDIEKVKEGDVLVTKMTSPDLVPTMSKSAAIITDEGGLTSHASIVSREMGIPAVVGTQGATKILKDGQKITVDAYRGMIYLGEVAVQKEKEIVLTKEEMRTKTAVKVNLVFPENLERVVNLADGVGLLRIEHMITKFGVHPAKLIREGRKEDYIKILIEGIKPIAKTFYPKPVWVRTLDARSDEFRNLEGGQEETEEDNPMIGWHGIRRSLDEPELLKAEFEAIKRLHDEGLDNVAVMLPFVISVEEFLSAKNIASEVGLPEKIGIMVETPAAAVDIEDFCKAGIAFASIGSNDLTQMTLGIDRNNAKIAKLYSEFHPSVIRLMENVIKTCSKFGIESSICGESGSNPDMAKILVGYGIRSISCNIDALEKIRKTVSEAEKN